MIDLWGLKNCDTCRHARRWLEAHGVEFNFHDVRDEMPGQDRLSRWLKLAGNDVLINRRGTTWRNLSTQSKQRIAANDVVPVLAAQPALMKRPILEHGKRITVGFDTSEYQQLFGKV